MTIAQVFGAVDAYVEQSARELGTVLLPAYERRRNAYMKNVRALNGESYRDGADEAKVRSLNDFSKSLFDALGPGAPRTRLNHDLPVPLRWEEALKTIGLGPSDERPLPADLAAVLTEIAQVRHTLSHRLGRLDQAVLDKIVVGPWTEVGQVVVVDDETYSVYLSALWAYGDELVDRLLIALGNEPTNASLDEWRTRGPRLIQ